MCLRENKAVRKVFFQKSSQIKYGKTIHVQPFGCKAFAQIIVNQNFTPYTRRVKCFVKYYYSIKFGNKKSGYPFRTASYILFPKKEENHISHMSEEYTASKAFDAIDAVDLAQILNMLQFVKEHIERDL